MGNTKKLEFMNETMPMYDEFGCLIDDEIIAITE